MSGLIEIRIDDAEVRRYLARLADRLDDMAPVMREIAADMLDAVHENFAREGRPAPWPELSPAYKRRLAKKGKTGKMLNRSAGGLFHSISADSDSHRARVGTNKRYAAIHHFGGLAGRNHAARIPARPYLSLTEADIRKILARVEKALWE